MTAPQIKVKIQRRPQIKLKVLPKFPGAVTVASPILLDRTGGNYGFSFDVNALLTSTTPTYDLRYQRISKYDTLTAAAASQILAEVNMVETLGRATIGDNGGARYIRISSGPATA
nr:hypothetical protein [Burkholderiales bacterium]